LNPKDLVSFHKSEIRNVSFGKNVNVIEPCNLYECTIGEGTFIGPFVEIQKGVRIGKNCKIQSHSFVCELVSIKDYCTIAHGVMFINDDFKSGGPAKGKRKLWKNTVIEDFVTIGSNATILPVRICSGAVIGAGSVVTKDITIKGVYAGNPVRKLRDL
jgi:acetyltransferase-like isoleucine patch superfamily enzyme